MPEAVGAHCAVITTGIDDIVHKGGAKSPDYRTDNRNSIILIFAALLRLQSVRIH